MAGLAPAACVVVATVRALKMHGGVGLKELGQENTEAVAKGCTNLLRHVENMRKFGLPVLVAINRFTADTPAELATIQAACRSHRRRRPSPCNHWAEGSAGADRRLPERSPRCDAKARPSSSRSTPTRMTLEEKNPHHRHQNLRRAGHHFRPRTPQRNCSAFTQAGFGEMPVCMAKTQYSFSADPTQKNGAAELHPQHP